MGLDALGGQRARGLPPLRPVIRGSNQNPHVCMQAVESANAYYDQLPGIIEETMLLGEPLVPAQPAHPPAGSAVAADALDFWGRSCGRCTSL